jgi:hypothetical protein
MIIRTAPLSYIGREPVRCEENQPPHLPRFISLRTFFHLPRCATPAGRSRLLPARAGGASPASSAAPASLHGYAAFLCGRPAGAPASPCSPRAGAADRALTSPRIPPAAGAGSAQHLRPLRRLHPLIPGRRPNPTRHPSRRPAAAVVRRLSSPPAGLGLPIPVPKLRRHRPSSPESKFRFCLCIPLLERTSPPPTRAPAPLVTSPSRKTRQYNVYLQGRSTGYQ